MGRKTVERSFLSYNVPDLEDTIVLGGLKCSSVTQRGLEDIRALKVAPYGFVQL